MVLRENKNNAYAKFGGTKKEYYGIVPNGLQFMNLFTMSEITEKLIIKQ